MPVWGRVEADWRRGLRACWSRLSIAIGVLVGLDYYSYAYRMTR